MSLPTPCISDSFEIIESATPIPDPIEQSKTNDMANKTIQCFIFSCVRLFFIISTFQMNIVTFLSF